MLSNKITASSVFIMCFCTIYLLFNIKNNVLFVSVELGKVQKQINYEKDKIRVLQAELAYLTSPSRLQKLNNKFIALQNTETSQMISDPIYYQDKRGNKMISNSKNNAKIVKWNFKKGPEKYLTLTSGKKYKKGK